MRRTGFALAAVAAAVMLAGFGGQPGLFSDSLTPFGGSGLSGVGDVAPTNAAPAVVYTTAIDTTDGVTTYTFDSGATDSDGTVDSLTWYVSGASGLFTYAGAAAANDTIQRELGPGTYTVSLLAKDDDGATGFFSQGVIRPDIRGVDASHNQATQEAPASAFPRTAIFSQTGHFAESPTSTSGKYFINTVDDYADTVVTAVLDLYADVDAVQYNGSRYFSPVAQAFHDSVLVRASDVQTIQYLRFNHAPRDLTLDSASYATADQFAGRIQYFADTVWQDYLAFNAAGDTAVIFANSSGDPAYFLANHWDQRGPEDLAAGLGYDLNLVTEYSDSLAAQINTFADAPFEAMMLDYFALGPNVWDSAAQDYGGGVDYNNSGSNDYEGFTWSNTAIRDGFWGWQLRQLQEHASDYPNTNIVVNGSWMDSPDVTSNGYYSAALALIQGVNFEGVPLTQGKGLQQDAYRTVLRSAELFDSHDLQWSKFGVWGNSSLAVSEGVDEITRVTAVLAMLGGAWIELGGESGYYNTRSELRSALAVLSTFGDVGEPSGTALLVEELGNDLVKLTRQFSGGRAEATFQVDPTTGNGWPITDGEGYTNTVRFVPNQTDPTIEAAFRYVDSGDSLTFDFFDESTSDAGSIDSWYWILSQAGQPEYFTPNFEHTFPAKSGPNNFYTVQLFVNNNEVNGVDAVIDTVWVAVPQVANVAPEAILATPTTADSLSYTFDASESTDSDGSILNYIWDWGDNTPDEVTTDPFNSHTYGFFGGNRTVTLIVEDNEGATDTTSATVFVKASPPVASGDLVINSIGGTISGGETFTINGQGFGATGPTIEIFDDFEAGTVGERLSITANSATIGEWDVVSQSGQYPRYSTDFALGGSQAVVCEVTDQTFNSEFNVTLSDRVDVGEKVYLSFWSLVPTGDVFPGHSRDSYNWKIAWFQGPGGTNDDDVTFATQLGSPPGNGVWGIAGNSSYISGCGRDGGTTGCKYPNVRIGEWHRFDTQIELSGFPDTDGDLLWRSFTATDGFKVLEDLTDQVTYLDGNTSDYYWSKLDMNGYARIVDSPDRARQVFDNVYLASGPGAWARVEILDTDNYGSSTSKVTLATVDSWSDTQIVATMRQGAFNTSDSAYVFVTTADGTVSNGYPVTIGSGAAVTAPSFTAITADDTTPDVDQSVTFGVTNSGGAPTSWTWELGDGTSIGSTAAPSYSFSSAGTYSIFVEGTNSAGTDTLTSVDFITVTEENDPPVASLSVTQGDSLTTIVLDGSLSSDADGTVDSLRFTPWPGSYTRAVATADQDTIRVDYTSQQELTQQTLTATLVAVDDTGNTSTADTADVIVKGSDTGGPVSIPFTYDFEDNAIPTRVTFSAWDADDTGIDRTSDLDLTVSSDFSDPGTTITEQVAGEPTSVGSYYLRLENLSVLANNVQFEIVVGPIDMTGLTSSPGAYMSFVSWKSYPGSTSTTVGVTTGISHGVYLSDDGGATWEGYNNEGIYQPSNDETWVMDTVDIDSELNDSGITFGSDMYIRFVNYIPAQFATHVFGIDNIKLSTGDKP